MGVSIGELDRNKSVLTHTATATAAGWLDCLGCKPVESEVPVADGWVADLASWWCPTMTEAKNSKLLAAMVPPEVQGSDHDRLAHLSRRVGGRLTIVVEVKVSRADFLGDRGRKYATNGRPSLASPAHLLVLAVPPGVILDNEYLWNWGVLRLSVSCERVTKFDGWGTPSALFPGQIEDLIAAIGIRRDHHTRYSGLRRMLRSYRARQTEEKRATRERNRKWSEKHNEDAA